jgi:hypothetical protein
LAIVTKSQAIVKATPAVTTAEVDWVEGSSEFEANRVFMDIVGPSGTGRTSLALTAPGPIALINADEKISGIVEPVVAAGKRVRIHTFRYTATDNPETTAAICGPVWDKVCMMMADSRTWAQSSIFDTGTEGWELVRLARFGVINPKGNRMDALYGPVNAEYRRLFKSFRGSSTNVISIHQVKDEYRDIRQGGEIRSTRTGREIRAGFKEFQYMADVVVRTGRNLETGAFTATIEKGWFNAQSEGVQFEGDPDLENPMSCHFANIMALITDTPKEDWL